VGQLGAFVTLVDGLSCHTGTRVTALTLEFCDRLLSVQFATTIRCPVLHPKRPVTSGRFGDIRFASTRTFSCARDADGRRIPLRSPAVISHWLGTWKKQEPIDYVVRNVLAGKAYTGTRIVYIKEARLRNGVKERLHGLSGGKVSVTGSPRKIAVLATPPGGAGQRKRRN
jgi:hypothetical protein